MSSSLRSWTALASAATLILLLSHAWYHRFLTDDAFISFRYAANFAAGDGLVFNPGEKVEGYSNFLWVLILAAFEVAGGEPETVSKVLGLLLTVVLWSQIAWFARRHDPDAWSLLPLLLLAVTRSVAVWSTSGLETRLFEVLVVGAVLRLAVELEGDTERSDPQRSSWASGLLFGLASLTRPDGPLIAATTFTAAILVVLRRRSSVRRVVKNVLVFSAITAAHFLFRRLYYGDWLPNTYYAKVGGEAWWSMGGRYLGAFLIEYAVWLWLPWLLAAVLWHLKRSTVHLPILFAAAVGPHVLYVATVGGDHFEYRPFDLYFPFAFLLIADGARELAQRGVPRKWLIGGLTAVVAGLFLLPWQSHRQFTRDFYRHGFPGLWVESDPAARQYLDPDRALLYRLPGLRSLAALHRDLVQTLSAAYVGLRAEEHAQFLATVVPEGQALRKLAETGEIDPGTRIAVDSVGAIPYYSRLPVLDRLGLTDREVARSPFRRRALLGHDKRATLDYGRRRGVDLWAVHEVHLLWKVIDLELHELLALPSHGRFPIVLVPTSQGLLLALQPQVERPDLADLEGRLATEDLRAKLAEQAIAHYRSMAAGNATGADTVHRKRLARLLELRGRGLEALAEYERAMVEGEFDLEVWRKTAGLRARSGDLAGAARLYHELLERGWDDADILNNLGNIRMLEDRAEAAIALYRRALAQEPERVENRLNLANALARTGRPQEAVAEVRAVLALHPGHPDANLRMAEDRLERGKPVAALGYFADALRADPQSRKAREGLEYLRRQFGGIEGSR